MTDSGERDDERQRNELSELGRQAACHAKNLPRPAVTVLSLRVDPDTRERTLLYASGVAAAILVLILVYAVIHTAQSSRQQPSTPVSPMPRTTSYSAPRTTAPPPTVDHHHDHHHDRGHRDLVHAHRERRPDRAAAGAVVEHVEHLGDDVADVRPSEPR